MRVSTLTALALVPAVAYAQSSSAPLLSSISSVLASGSSTGSVSATASSSAASSSASSSSNSSSTYLTSVLGALPAANLTSLVGVASAIAQTPEGIALLASLSNGNKTVFAPSNSAFDNVPESVSSNTTLLTQILSYHILNTTYTSAGVRIAPNHTIARTLLRGGGYSLPGNRTAPLVLSKSSSNGSSFMIDQLASNVTTMGPAMAANLYVYIIDEVLSLPSNLSTVAFQAAPSLASIIQTSGLLGPLESANGITVFAPNDAAISGAMSLIGTLNATQIQAVLANHVINGTVAYSTGLASTNYTSAGGEPFKFMSNATGTYVMSANSTARIVRSDVIINNGVVHVIDGVLANTASNPGAAASAVSSQSAVIATSTENNSPVTATSQAAGGGSSASASASRAAAGAVAPLGFAKAAFGGIVGVIGALAGGFMLI